MVETSAPHPDLLRAMRFMQTGDNLRALASIEDALPTVADELPYRALGGLAALKAQQPERAVPHLQRALELKPDDPASLQNLASAYVQLKDFDAVITLAEKMEGPLLARAEGFAWQERGEPEKAAVLYRQAIESDPGDLASLNNLGNIYVSFGKFDEAIQCFEAAITLAPADVSLYLNLADALRKADRGEARLKVMLDAIRLAPNDRQVLTELALAQAHVEDLDAAIATLERTNQMYPDFGESQLELGRLFEALNRIDDLEALVNVIDFDEAPAEAAFLNAWLALRNEQFDEAVSHAQDVPETVHPMRRFHLIGQIEDRRGNTDTAFEAFSRMNAEAVADTPPLAGPTFREVVEQDTASWTNQWAEGFPGTRIDDDWRDPIFLVGFPRSGTTLLDTMLMGLNELHVIEERPLIAPLARTLQGMDIRKISDRNVLGFRRQYFALARQYGWTDDRWLVDKHPLNMVRVPLIKRVFPQAKFILAERHPYDVALSCFMANFQMNFAMRSFTSLEETARTYDAAFTAWERATNLLPVDTHAVRYERLITSPTEELRPVTNWLSVEWDDALLDHQRTAEKRGRVRTASYSQIRERLYSRAQNRWTRYAEHLLPIVPILLPWVEKMGYSSEN